MMTGKNNTGLTLIELMIAMAISSILMLAIYGIYKAQVTGIVSQESMLDMQQTARTAFEIMESEIRQAGCNPFQAKPSPPIGFQITGPGQLQFTMDTRDNAGNPSPDGDALDPGENVTYLLTNDAARDGRADGTPCDLGWNRNDGNGVQPLAENIDAINFVYLDRFGAVTVDPLQIRRIEVTMVARSGEQMRGLIREYNSVQNFTNLRGQTIYTAPDDGFRRLAFSATLFVRN